MKEVKRLTAAMRVEQTTVLVVDDDNFSQDLARRAPANLGFTKVQVATDGKVGLRALDAMLKPPDGVICDIFMPDRDGIEFVNELAMRDYTGGVILVSGGDMQLLSRARQIALESGLNVLGAFRHGAGLVAQLRHFNLLGTLKKPVTKEALAQLIPL